MKFKTSGKEILEPGWRVVFETEIPTETSEAKEGEEGGEASEALLPTFTEGETGEHIPELREKQTQPPKYYTEATLLRAMETAGKFVEQEELREAMKENGIGRPSTRANIIETLFKRGYIVKEKRSQIHATETGRQLIKLINYDLLKSAALTGEWEYKLRQIERRELETKSSSTISRQCSTSSCSPSSLHSRHRHLHQPRQPPRFPLIQASPAPSVSRVPFCEVVRPSAAPPSVRAAPSASPMRSAPAQLRPKS